MQISHFFISSGVVAGLARLEVLVLLLVVPLLAKFVLVPSEILLVQAAPHLQTGGFNGALNRIQWSYFNFCPFPLEVIKFILLGKFLYYVSV